MHLALGSPSRELPLRVTFGSTQLKTIITSTLAVVIANKFLNMNGLAGIRV